MRGRFASILLAACLAPAACRGGDTRRGDDPAGLAPPVAPRAPVRTELHGDVLVDPYAWMRERDDPRTRAYLEAENRYADGMTRHTSALRQRLFDEMLARIVEDDVTVPAVDGPFAHYARGVKGKPYP
ncbi:MAG TPA: hypothetical protein VFG69_10730, partial [Nannocystaceae bacterium]|nr:hypothetical protein [Nannocystaceae bacterium]